MAVVTLKLRPQTVHIAAKIDRVKDSIQIILISVFSLLRFHILSRNVLSKRFALYFLLLKSS